jgi:hypothetical protein
MIPARDFLVLAIFLSGTAYADTGATSSAPTTVYSSTTGGGSTDWSTYEADTAPASISAAGMLGVSGGALTNVESVKDLSVAISGLTSGSNNGVGLSFTPARSAISPMSQQMYVGSWGTIGDGVRTVLTRLIGSTTLGYATNDTTLSQVDYKQQAVSIQTTGFFNEADDPVISLYQALKPGGPGCGPIFPASTAPPVAAPSPPPGGSTNAPAAPAADQATEEANWAACKTKLAKDVPWNPDTYSIGFATGWIRPKAGGTQYSLGRTFFVGAQVGFGGHSDPASSSTGILLAVAYRLSLSEPVLDSLATTNVVTQRSSIGYVKLSGGSSTLRVVAEYNSTRTTDVTESQLALKEAIGIDARLATNTWINFRFGKQNTDTGSSTQTASLFSISYSPAALLSH